MPSVSEKQRKFFGAELGRERAGEKTQTGLPEASLKDFAKAIKPKPAKAAKKAAPPVPKAAKGAPKIPPFEPNPPVKRPGPMGGYSA